MLLHSTRGPIRTTVRGADDITVMQETGPTCPNGAPAPEPRELLASTPAATPTLWATNAEDAAVLALRKHGHLTLPRFDHPDRNGTTLPDLHLGAIRLLDRGIIRLAAPTEVPNALTDTHATWVWNGHRGESMGLRLQRWRTLTFLPFQTGYYGLTPEDGMSGPLMAAVLAWHHAHTGIIRLDLSTTRNGSASTVRVVQHHHDGTTRTRDLPANSPTRRLPLTPRSYETAFRPRQGDDFSLALLRRNPHLPPTANPEDRLHPVHEDRLLHALCTRIAPALFGQAAVSVDLNTWLLHSHGQAPSVDAVIVPLDVQDALAVLGAPVEACTHRPRARGWLAAHPLLTVGCRDTSPREPDRSAFRTTLLSPTGPARPASPFANAPVARGWRHRHTLALDPSTGTVHTVAPRTPSVRQRFEADHTLAGLLGTDPTCAALSRTLNGNDARALARTLETHRYAPVTADRIEAAWRIARWIREPDVWLPPAHHRTR